MRIIIMIGDGPGRLPQMAWESFHRDVVLALENHRDVSGVVNRWEAYGSVCWLVDVSDPRGPRGALRRVAERYPGAQVAFMEGPVYSVAA